MTKEEIFADREFVARKVLRNLHKYGNIFPDGHFFRGVHGTSENISPMERPNYLRYAAYLKEGNEQDTDHHHFVNLQEAAALNIHINEKSVPLYLEHWHGSPHTGYTATLEPYYVAEELSGQVWANSPEMLNRLATEIGWTSRDKGDYFLDHPKEYAEELRFFAMQKAIDNGNDQLTAKAFSQVVLAEYGLSVNYRDNPLFTKDELLVFEAKPASLYETFYRATDMVKEMHKTYEKAQEAAQDVSQELSDIPLPDDEMAESAISENNEETFNQEIEEATEASTVEVPPTSDETTETITESEQENNELFSSLKIHIDWIDAPIRDWDGHEYESNTTLTGIKAYEFLVKYNEMDKELFNNCYTGCDGKSRISFEYNGYKHNNGESFRIDLGDLEFGNRQSIYEALKYRLLLYTNSVLNSDREAQMLLNMHKDEFKSLDDVKTVFTEQKTEILAFLDDFRKEEQAFYKIDRHAQAINEIDAQPFLYLMRRSDWENEPVTPRGAVRPMHQYTMGEVSPDKLKDYCLVPPNLYINTMKKIATSEEEISKIDSRYLEKRNGLPSDMWVVLASRNHPDTFETSNFLVAIPQERIDRLKGFQHLKITITGYDSVKYRDFTETYQGYLAADKLEEYIRMDGATFEKALDQGYSQPAFEQQYRISISWDDKEVYTLNYKNGTGELVAAYNNPMNPMLPPEAMHVMSNALIEAEHTAYDMGVLRYMPSNKEKELPDYMNGREYFFQTNEDYKKLLQNRPPRITKEYAQKCYEVYAELASINPSNTFPEKFAIDMAKSMAVDGFKSKQIATIAKYNQGYQKNADYLAKASQHYEIKNIERLTKNKGR